MAKAPNKPQPTEYRRGNEAYTPGIKGGARPHKEPPVPGQMTLGKSHDIGARKGTFSGKASDLRSEQGSKTRFGRADYHTAGPVSGGGAGHTKQTSGHSSLSRGKFGKTPGKMNPQG